MQFLSQSRKVVIYQLTKTIGIIFLRRGFKNSFAHQNPQIPTFLLF